MPRPSRSRRRRTPLDCESLEPRRVLSGSPPTGIWTIPGGTDSDDVIVVDRDPARSARLRATVNHVVVATRREALVGVIRIDGGAGNDSISVDIPGNSRIRTRLFGGLGDDTITGSDGSDSISGGPGRDTLSGGRGPDRIWGNGGDDAITGGQGGDRVSGGNGADSITGGDGSDILRGDAGRDTIRGGRGHDRLVGGPGRDTFFGTAGVDSAELEQGERLIGNESTNPLEETDDLDALHAWYIDTAMRRWGDVLGTASGRGPIVYDTATTVATALPTAAGNVATAGSDHSGTNTQVAGVDEGDLVETDGRHLFVLAGDGVDILSAVPADGLALLAHVPIEGNETALLLHGTRLTVISQTYGIRAIGIAIPASGIIGGDLGGGPRTAVTVLDVSNPAAPAVVERTEIDGWLVSSRAIGDRVIIVTQDGIDIPAPQLIADPSPPEPVDPIPLTGIATPRVFAIEAPQTIDLVPVRPWWWGGTYEDAVSYQARLEDAWAAGVLPKFTVDDGTGATDGGTLVAAGRAYLPVNPDSGELLSVVSFELGDDVAGPESVTSVAGVSGMVYASTSSLYVAATTSGSWWNVAGLGVTTNIYKFDLTAASIPLVSMGAVPGQVLDQFSLDEHDGLLRVATTTWSVADAGSSSGVHVLRDHAGNLSVVGAVDRLAPGERIYSARFVGDRAYVSTFRQIDPFFVIDLSEPSAPRVEGELKVPGFSSYLQPLDDTHVLGIGRDADPATGRALGVQVSLFDVSNPSAPVRSAVHTFPGEGWEAWSQALADHHAVSWFPEQGILALPGSRFTTDGTADSLWVLRVDLGAKAGFTVLGEVQHDSPVLRSVRIGDVLYSISVGEVQAHPLAAPAEVTARARLRGFDVDGGPIIVAW